MKTNQFSLMCVIETDAEKHENGDICVGVKVVKSDIPEGIKISRIRFVAPAEIPESLLKKGEGGILHGDICVLKEADPKTYMQVHYGTVDCRYEFVVRH